MMTPKNTSSGPTTCLHGRCLRLARLGWLVFVALDLLLFSLAIPATYQASLRQALTADNSALVQLGMSVQGYAAWYTGLPLDGFKTISTNDTIAAGSTLSRCWPTSRRRYAMKRIWRGYRASW